MPQDFNSPPCTLIKNDPEVMYYGLKGKYRKVTLVQIEAKKVKRSGRYTKKTKQRVAGWQGDNKIKADGIVGPGTWNQMFCTP